MIFQPFSDPKNRWSSYSKPAGRQATSDHNLLAFSAPEAQALGLDNPKFSPDICCRRRIFRYFIIRGRATILYA
jgi:hypothetical protein